MKDDYKASATFAFMPILCEVDSLKGKHGKSDMLKAFYEGMKADDAKVRYAASGAELESR